MLDELPSPQSDRLSKATVLQRMEELRWETFPTSKRVSFLAAEGNRIVTASTNGHVEVWLLSTGTRLHERKVMGSIDHIALSRDGRWLACSKEKIIKIFDLTQPDPLGSGHEENSKISDVTALAFGPGPDRQVRLYVGLYQGIIQNWNIAPGKIFQSDAYTLTDYPISTIAAPRGHQWLFSADTEYNIQQLNFIEAARQPWDIATSQVRPWGFSGEILAERTPRGGERLIFKITPGAPASEQTRPWPVKARGSFSAASFEAQTLAFGPGGDIQLITLDEVPTYIPLTVDANNHEYDSKKAVVTFTPSGRYILIASKKTVTALPLER